MQACVLALPHPGSRIAPDMPRPRGRFIRGFAGGVDEVASAAAGFGDLHLAGDSLQLGAGSHTVGVAGRGKETGS